jgi:SPP1 family predicted phage head-tail adaptor
MANIKDIGELKQRIDIEQKSESQDAFGEPTFSWSTLDTVWAKVEMETRIGSEEQLADKKTNVKPTFFTIRLRSDINETNRISYRSQTYQILNIAEVQDRTFNVIEAVKYE